MRISVITPTKDRPEAVRLCRRWFIEQSSPPDEHLVIEGGTACENILKGMGLATGDIIVVADDDDHYRPDWLSFISSAFQQDSSLRYVGQRVKFMHHLRAERYSMVDEGPQIGNMAFVRDEIPTVAHYIGTMAKPKQSYFACPKRLKLRTNIQYCRHIKGLYPSGGVSVRHDPKKHPYSDLGLVFLRREIGNSAVDAYIQAMQEIDARCVA